MLHHGHRGRRGNYSQSELAEWAERIGEWATTLDVFAEVNNDWEELAPSNALVLKRLLDLRCQTPRAMRSRSRLMGPHVTAPSEALDTSFAYFPRTPPRSALSLPW